jgi:hypothetical protein
MPSNSHINQTLPSLMTSSSIPTTDDDQIAQQLSSSSSFSMLRKRKHSGSEHVEDEDDSCDNNELHPPTLKKRSSSVTNFEIQHEYPGNDSGNRSDTGDAPTTQNSIIAKQEKPIPPMSPPVSVTTPKRSRSRSRTPFTAGQYACTYPNCDRSYKKPAKLKQHMLSHTGEVIISFLTNFLYLLCVPSQAYLS